MILVTLILSLALLTTIAHVSGLLDREGLQSSIASAGILAPILYVVLASLLIAVWVPRGLLSMISGALFGLSLGAVLALIMGVIGALGGYLLGISLGSPYLDERIAQDGSGGRSRQKRIVEFIRARGFWAILACRVCPLVPSELISVTSGITKIRLWHFVIASVLGMAPGAFLYSAFGASLLDEEARWITYASIGGFAMLTLITGAFLTDLWNRDHRSGPSEPPTQPCVEKDL